jgi:hypothetical protein
MRRCHSLSASLTACATSSSWVTPTSATRPARSGRSPRPTLPVRGRGDRRRADPLHQTSHAAPPVLSSVVAAVDVRAVGSPPRARPGSRADGTSLPSAHAQVPDATRHLRGWRRLRRPRRRPALGPAHRPPQRRRQAPVDPAQGRHRGRRDRRGGGAARGPRGDRPRRRDRPLLGTIDYWFVWRPDQIRYHKFVHYYFMWWDGQPAGPRDDEAEHVEWVPSTSRGPARAPQRAQARREGRCRHARSRRAMPRPRSTARRSRPDGGRTLEVVAIVLIAWPPVSAQRTSRRASI